MIRMRLCELREVLSRELLVEVVIPSLKPWPEESKQIPEMSEADFAAKVGPFERRLAAVLGGDVVGGSKSHDIVAAGAKYEVKKPNHKAMIRLGNEGTTAFARAKNEIETACKALAAAFKPDSVVFSSFTSLMDQDDVKEVVSFVQTEVPALVRGNFSVSRMRRFHAIITKVAAVLRAKDGADDKVLLMGDNEHTVERDINVQPKSNGAQIGNTFFILGFCT
jgi:hypothetical protein